MKRRDLVIPANNEQSTVGEVVEGCKHYCDEVIIDDASSDLTSETARRAGESLEMRFGLGF